ncbi:hypothetical protein ACKF11_13495 [Methylobacillus sp. Pita2]|uniref:hypothetical protein n=1 Tax=Methylobacillus sp. Pita2 TaxID=3383245 RepID=UPI0038B49E07
MSMVDSLIDFLEEMSTWVGSGLKQHAADYIDIETNDSRNVLALKDGSLISIVRLHGSRKLMGAEEFEAMHGEVHRSLKSYMSDSNGYSVQVFYQVDQDGIDRRLGDLYAPSVRAAEGIGFSIKDMVEDRIKAMSAHCHMEDTFFVLRTKLNALSPSDLKASRARSTESYKKKGGATSKLAQNPLVAVGALRDRHKSFVSAFTDDLNNAGLIIELLEAHAACRAIRKTIDPDFTDDSWKPSLVGDKLPIRLPNNPRDDISNLLWPKISDQLCPRDGRVIDHQFYAVGNRIHATVAVELPPMDPQHFNSLFKRMLNAGIPWRMSMTFESGGLKSIWLKRLMASILGFAHSGNSSIVEAYKTLEQDVKATGDIDTRFSIVFSTWVSNGDINLLSSRLSQLARGIEAWGSCEVNEISGDSAEGFMSTVLGQSSDGVAVPCAAPLDDVVRMMPITRPASPWRAGTVIYRTPDGLPWPYSPGSPLQAAWIELFFAGMGSGKSVNMNSINLALCSDPRLKRLPRIAILDIGTSSAGLIEAVRDQLPANRKHEVAYHRLRMTNDCAINGFDTILGNRRPIASHRAFLTNFLLLLTTPVGHEKPHDGMADMIGIVIDETYKLLSDGAGARRYSENTDPEVDKAIADNGIKIDSKTSWWEVVDDLFAKGDYHAAGMAQRYAVPTLSDTIEVARSPQITDLFRNVLETGETPSDGYNRAISTAIREYPIIGKPTKFDISAARVVSLDLDEVAKTGGPAADKQTSVMYMLGRFVLARDFYLTNDNLAEINPTYSAFHKQRIKEGSEDIKRLCMDEIHRTKRAVAVREQLITDIREGRKWGVHVALASQDMTDFDPIMISLATTIFIMGKFDQRDVQDISERFGLSETAKIALVKHTHGPRPKIGTTFLINMVTKDYSERTSQLVTSTIGPIEYWTFSTTAEDRIIRTMLYAKMGGIDARRMLATSYPFGISDEVKRRSEELVETVFDDKITQGIIDDIFNEIVEAYNKEMRLKAK